MGIVGLEGLRFHAYHGVYESEKKMGGEFQVDVYLKISIVSAAQTDNISETVDYSQVYHEVAEEMKIRCDLLETVVYRLVKRLLNRFSKIESCRIRLSKLKAPLGGPCERTYVEYEETR